MKYFEFKDIFHKNNHFEYTTCQLLFFFFIMLILSINNWPYHIFLSLCSDTLEDNLYFECSQIPTFGVANIFHLENAWLNF